MQGRSGPKPKFTISRLVVIMEDGNFRPVGKPPLKVSVVLVV